MRTRAARFGRLAQLAVNQPEKRGKGKEWANYELTLSKGRHMYRRRVNTRLLAGAAAPLLLVALAACGSGDGAAKGSARGLECDGKIEGNPEIEVWYHTGTSEARDVLTAQVKEFNASQDDVKVKLTLLPEGNYSDQVAAASAAGDLPALLDFDGPFLYSYAWNEDLVPLDSCVPEDLKADLLPSILSQGTYSDSLYGVGQVESTLGLYSRRSVLEKNGIRVPSGPSDAWTAEEFTTALGKLQDAGFKQPLDLKMNYAEDEWFTFAMSPVVWSAGGDLIDRSDFDSADGELNSPEVVDAFGTVQSWFERGYVDPNDDDAAFMDGRSPISWVGQWEYSRYSEAYGDDLVVLPLPDFGEGTRSGQGNWQWGVTDNVEDLDAAWSFIEYVLRPDELLPFAEAAGGLPSRSSVLERSKLYGPDGELHVLAQQLEDELTVARPQTPAYPKITSEFADAFREVSNGGAPEAALDNAVTSIDQFIEDNSGFPVQ